MEMPRTRWSTVFTILTLLLAGDARAEQSAAHLREQAELKATSERISHESSDSRIAGPDKIKKIQKILFELNYDVGLWDGKAEPQTRAAKSKEATLDFAVERWLRSAGPQIDQGKRAVSSRFETFEPHITVNVFKTAREKNSAMAVSKSTRPQRGS
jgi:hypothetical protein